MQIVISTIQSFVYSSLKHLLQTN